jgi:hypothetical protein
MEGFILLIVITIMVLYLSNNTYSNQNKCDEYIPYFDNNYNRSERNKIARVSGCPSGCPHCCNVEYKAEGLNDLVTTEHQMKPSYDKTNIMKSRWSSSNELLTKNNSGSNEYSNMDNIINPKQLQKHLGLFKPEHISSAKYQSKNEQFADDGYYDPKFSYNEKYYFNEDTENTNHLLDPTFNIPNTPAIPSINNIGGLNIPNSDIPMVQSDKPVLVVKPVVVYKRKNQYDPALLKKMCDRRLTRKNSWF